MKGAMMMRLPRVLLSVLLFLLLTVPATGKEPKEPEEVDEYSMTLAENIAYPPVSGKKNQKIVEAMRELRRRLVAKRYQATMERGDEVVCVTIPVAELFRANSSELAPEGKRRLRDLEQYVEHDSQFKVLIAVHHDDTGDESYADDLTGARANAIDDYFEGEAGREMNIIPYGIGMEEPVSSNATKKGRAMNRRAEIYFVPTTAYIKSLNGR